MTTPGMAAAALKAGGVVSDRHFDAVYPVELRFISHQHWTPVDVAVRAARLLVNAGARKVLDVGAGPGKFCIIGALTTDAAYVGVERRPWLVDVARMAAVRLGADRARFAAADMIGFDFDGFDGFYLFNPFLEQIDGGLLSIDQDLVPSRAAYFHYVAAVEQKLAGLAAGTAVVTYNGFGGSMPHGYQLTQEQAAGSDSLVLWTKS
jgi:hypothetical protein